MDRTIPPETPEGEDAGAVEGVVDPGSSRRNRASRRGMVPNRCREATGRDPVARTDMEADPEVVPADRTVRNSVVREP